jgi:hypothetical protein
MRREHNNCSVIFGFSTRHPQFMLLSHAKICSDRQLWRSSKDLLHERLPQAFVSANRATLLATGYCLSSSINTTYPRALPRAQRTAAWAMPSESGDYGLWTKAPHDYFEQNLHTVTTAGFRPQALLEHAHLAYLILLNVRPSQGYQTKSH